MSHEPIINYPGVKRDPVITGKLTLTPYSIALLKNKAVVNNTDFDVFQQFLNKNMIPDDYELCSLIHGSRDGKNSEKVTLKHESMIEISLRQQSMAMLKCILSILLTIAKPSSIAKVYEVVFSHDKDHKLLSEIYTMMIAQLHDVTKSRHEERHEELKFVAETLIVCNQPDRLETLIKVLDPNFRCKCLYYEGNWNYIYNWFSNHFSYNCFSCNCKRTCKILQRAECESIFDTYCRSETLKRLNKEQKGLNETTKIDLKYSRDEVEGPLLKYSRDRVERPLLKYSRDEVEGPLLKYSQDGVEGPLLKYSQDRVEGPLLKYSQDGVEGPLLKYSQDGVEGPLLKYSQNKVEGPLLKYSQDEVERPLLKYSRDGMEGPLLKYSQDKVEGPHTCDFEDNNVFIGVKKRSFMYLLHDHPFSKNAIQEALKLMPNISHDINLSSANGLPPLRLYICNKMNIEAVRLLLENGCQVRSGDQDYSCSMLL